MLQEKVDSHKEKNDFHSLDRVKITSGSSSHRVLVSANPSL